MVGSCTPTCLLYIRIIGPKAVFLKLHTIVVASVSEMLLFTMYIIRTRLYQSACDFICGHLTIAFGS